MNIGVIDADLLDNGTRHPNLALMKISAYNKEIGNKVSLLLNYQEIENYNKVFISKVFSYTKVPNDLLEHNNIIIGGTGFFEDGGENLEPNIEHHMPDYHLYDKYISKSMSKGKKNVFKDYLDYSIGFTTRGCFRKCEFCVNKKYNHVFLHSPVKEFLDEARRGIYLWDDNFFGFPGWEKILNDLEATGKHFQFRQGLDIRLLTKNKAFRLANTKYDGDYIFAFDYIKDKPLIIKNLQMWRRFSLKSTKLYLLCGYESQDLTDIVNLFERIIVLMKYKCLPFVMRHERYKKSKYKDLYIQIARWCNLPRFFKKMSFREFCLANQSYCKTKNMCASMRALNNFENEHPYIAKLYFDIRFEDVNIY